MKRRFSILCLSLVVFAPAILGFKCGGSTAPPATGFRIRTLFIVRSSTGVDILRRGVPALIAGNWQFDQGAANGNVKISTRRPTREDVIPLPMGECRHCGKSSVAQLALAQASVRM